MKIVIQPKKFQDGLHYGPGLLHQLVVIDLHDVVREARLPMTHQALVLAIVVSDILKAVGVTELGFKLLEIHRQAYIQGLALGKGIYYRFEETRADDDDGGRALGILGALPDYSARRIDDFPDGTRVYLMGEPIGILHSVTVRQGTEERTLRVVHRAILEWRFVWFDERDVYPAGWAVESIRPVEGRTEFTDLTGVF